MVGSGGSAELTQFAADIAPCLDRARLAIVAFLRSKADGLSQRYGIAPPALQTLGMLRNTLPDRAVAIDDVLDLFVYAPPEQIRDSLEQLGTARALEPSGDGRVVVTATGRDILTTMYELSQQFVDARWADHAELVAQLLPIADRACAAATTSGGAGVRVVAPVYDPPGASAPILLAERLTPLRFHRFDAHVDAWRSAGLTVEEIQGLEPGPLLDQIETETNRWAAAPYCGLSPDEREQLLRGLELLPS